jgi:Rrf2 family protein
MSGVSQKCQYALRAIFELAKRRSANAPVTVGELAEAQRIPTRFLEQILMQLRQGGYVESRRGIQGGHVLLANPRELTVGEIIEFIEGPVSPVRFLDVGGPRHGEGHRQGDMPRRGRQARGDSPLGSESVFMVMWKEARDALVDVYGRWTFQDLIEREKLMAKRVGADYCI